jgi:hypothetical protein
MLAVTDVWKLIEESKMVDLRNSCLNFDLQEAGDKLKNAR